MPSAVERCQRIALVIAVLGAGMAPAAAATLPPREKVESAVAETKQDPNLPGTRTERQWQLKKRDEPAKPETQPSHRQDRKKSSSSDPLSSGARLLVWGLGAVAVLWLLWRLRHWMGLRADAATPRRRELPSHVGELDIRPDSLPTDVGLAARALWQQGQGRAALSLLYRGALSRLVHDYEVPIRAASTEGECVAHAAPRLSPAGHAFLAELVAAWQTAAYAGRWPDGARVLALCERLDAELPATHLAAPALPRLGGAAA